MTDMKSPSSPFATMALNIAGAKRSTARTHYGLSVKYTENEKAPEYVESFPSDIVLL